MSVQIPEMWAGPRKHSTQELGELFEKSSEGKLSRSWALSISGTAGPRCPPFTQATMLLAFIAGMQLVNDTRWLYRTTFQTFLLGQKLHLWDSSSLERPVTAGSKRSKVWPFLPRHNIRHKNLLSCYILYFEIWKHILNTLKAFIKMFSARISH